MKLLSTFAAVALYQAVALALPAEPLEKRSTVQGFDISHYQGTVDFKGAYSSGARFVIIKVDNSRLAAAPIMTLTTYDFAGNRRHQLHRLRLHLPL